MLYISTLDKEFDKVYDFCQLLKHSEDLHMEV